MSLDTPLRRPLRVTYLAGPGDAPDVLRRRAADEVFDEVAHQSYSGQLFDVCEEMGAEVLSVSWHARTDDFTHGRIRAINRPNHLTGKSGPSYHLSNIRFAWDVAKDVWKQGSDILLTSTEPHPFLIEPLVARGVKLVTAFHATLLPEFKEPSRGAKLVARMSRHFYERSCTAILSHPGLCTTQVVALTEGRSRPIVEFLPLYKGDSFEGIPAPRRTDGKFRIIQVGRLEASKGVFVLIEVARRAREAGRTDFHFDVCGTGGALEDARRKVRELGLEDSFVLHGWTELDDLLELWGQSHIAVVPTTPDFVEGFNQVIVEALLAGRPVITSPVCPSLDFARESAIEVPHSDAGAFYDAIVRLTSDTELYDRLQSNCAWQAKQFLDPGRAFYGAVKHVFTAIAEGREVTPVFHPPVERDPSA